MRVFILLISLLITTLVSSQTIRRWSILTYNGTVVDDKYVIDKSDMEAGGIPSPNNKIIIKESKIIVKGNGYKKLNLSIKKVLRDEKKDDSRVITWRCLDKSNKLEYIVTYTLFDESEYIFFEWDNLFVSIKLVKFKTKF